MKVQTKCIKDVLFTLEELLIVDESNEGFIFKSVNLDTLYTELGSKYNKSEILYTIYILKDGEFIKANITEANSVVIDCTVTVMTNKGHTFADSLRSKKVFEKIQEILPVVSSATVLAMNAATLTTSLMGLF